MSAAIEVLDATFRYAGADSPSACDVTLSVAPGECVVLTGASGSGKTTVARMVNGLAGDFYEGELSGSVKVGGKEVASLASWERAALIGSVFQNPRTQFFNLDTTGEVVFGMENLGVARPEMRRRYGDVVRELGIEGLMGRRIFGLSGGQKQAIAFASAWATEPAAYVLDEPSSNLDPDAMAHLAGFIGKAKRAGAAILVAEHRLFWLADVADRFVCMKGGRVVGSWTPKELAALPDAERERLCMRSLSQPSFGHLERSAIRGGAHACEAKSLRAGYSGKQVLDRIDFDLDEGEVVGVVGENGRGKTTLFRCLCGLHREEAGAVLFGGAAVAFRRRPDRAFLVMQDVDYQLFRPSVRAELDAAALRGGRSPEEVEGLLSHLGLGGLEDRHPASLSGGQKQRVVCAVAALASSDVILLDEPTSGLDYGSMRRLGDLLREFANRGKAVAVISHDAEFVSRACDRVIRL